MQRRNFIRNTAIGITAAATAGYAMYRWLQVEGIDVSGVLREWQTPPEIAQQLEMGFAEERRILKQFYEDLQTLPQTDLRERLLQLKSDDFTNDNVTEVKGWVLSRTEIALSIIAANA